jgi:hypothetical protein
MLFYPTVTDEHDVEAVTRQAFWVMAAIGTLRLVFALFQQDPFSAIFEPLFYYLAAFGVRQRSRSAAIGALVAYLASIVLNVKLGKFPFGYLDLVILGILFSTVRGTWLSARLRREAGSEPPPMRYNATWKDRLVDIWPIWVWPKAQWLFYVMLALSVIGVISIIILPANELR